MITQTDGVLYERGGEAEEKVSDLSIKIERE